MKSDQEFKSINMENTNRDMKSAAFLLLTLCVFFTGVIFLLKNYFFTSVTPQIEESYIESDKSLISSQGSEIEDVFEKKPDEDISELLWQYYASAAPFLFHYFPDDFENTAQSYAELFSTFLNAPSVKKSVFDLHIQMHQAKYDVRWKMKNKSIKMYWVDQLSQQEFLAVAIHEFAHFVDIYYFQKKVIRDLSENFYGISWDSTKIIKSWQSQKDFVSGYAMTNKYEDFAESFTYYILHNKDFLQKAETSETLMKKYKYFWVYFFKHDHFKWEDFSIDNEILDYYRDITKIPYNLENLLQYLKKWI